MKREKYSKIKTQMKHFKSKMLVPMFNSLLKWRKGFCKLILGPSFDKKSLSTSLSHCKGRCRCMSSIHTTRELGWLSKSLLARIELQNQTYFILLFGKLAKKKIRFNSTTWLFIIIHWFVIKRHTWSKYTLLYTTSVFTHQAPAHFQRDWQLEMSIVWSWAKPIRSESKYTHSASN